MIMGMYKCIYMSVCNDMYILCIRVYVYVCGVYVYGVYMYDCKGVSLCVWMHVAVISDTFVRSGPVTGDSELYLLWIRYTCDSKTDP